VICETSGQAVVPAILGHSPPPPGTVIRLGDGLAATTIDPDAALGEWMSSQVGSALSRVLGGSRSFGQFISAAPGARELVTITKAWELGPGRSWQRGQSGHDTVILDAPATGHGVAMLRAPRTFADIAGAGPIHDQAEKVWQLLADPSRSAIVAVTLPAELPVGETLDLETWTHETLGRGLDAVIANRCCPTRFTAAELDEAELAAGRGAVPDGAVAVARAELSRSDAERSLLAELEQGVAKTVELPEFPADVEPGDLAHMLSGLLAGALA